MKWLSGALSALLVAFAGSASPAAPPLDEAAITTERFGNDAAWYRGRIPLFASSDALLDRVYYYRWQVFRAHQRDLGAAGYITTEFLDDVGWQREPYASLNDATPFHIREGRWLRDRRFTDDYVRFLYERGGNDRHFSESIAEATWGRYLVDGDLAGAARYLPAMRHIYGLWDDHFDFTRGLYWIEPLLDATEYTIASIDASGGKDGFTGGWAYRPSINAYQYGNARAIAALLRLTGDEASARDYEARAAALRSATEASLWSGQFDHYIDRHQRDTEFVRAWQPIRGRELVGYVPWAFDMPPDTPARAKAWTHVLRSDRLAGRAGPRTVEPSYQYYMRQYRYDKESGRRECQWNGPSWPFQTTQLLIAMGNLLDHYNQRQVTRSDYLRLLRQYAQLHLQGARADLEEDYDPDTGAPIVGLARSHHYFHSGYNDLVIGGLVGIRPRSDDVLEVNPLVPTGGADPLRWFALQDVPYHGRRVTVLWDADGRHWADYGRGLTLLVDDKVVATSPSLKRLTVPLQRAATAPIARPINLAVNLVRGRYPLGSASTNASPEALHDALDGRLWFFPEAPNGWEAAAVDGRDSWFAVDFGRKVPLGRVELAFFADGKAFDAPAGYRVQALTAQGWRDVSGLHADPPVANGVTQARFAPVSTTSLRVVFTPRPGRGLRLVELKAFS
jgi:hypothetical protein